jgi:predicted regulator of amino acid metabolism with ACT domain
VKAKKRKKKITRRLIRSGMKINEAKTEICIFHRKVRVVTDILINNIKIKSTKLMKILGINRLPYTKFGFDRRNSVHPCR